MVEDTSSFSSLEKVFSGFIDTLSNFSSSEILESFLFQHISSFFYANIIYNFFNNLNEKNALEMNLNLERLSDIKKRFTNIENEAKNYLLDFKDYKKIKKEYYNFFKKNVEKEFLDFFPTLLEIEKLMGLSHFEKFLIHKKEVLKKISRSENDYKICLMTKVIELGIEKNKISKLNDLLYLESILKDNNDLVEHAAKLINAELYEKEKSRLLLKIQKNRCEILEFEKRLYERWQTALDLYEMMIDFSIELGEKQKNRFPNKDGLITNLKHIALLKIHSRSILISKEVLVLLKSGFVDGAQAHARWRTFHELAVISFFLQSNEEYVSERYLDHSYMRMIKGTKDFNTYSDRTDYEKYTENELKLFERKKQDLIKKHGKDFDACDLGWIPISLIKNRKFVELEKYTKIDHLRPYYNWSSSAIHGGANAFDYLGIPQHIKNKLFFIGPSNFGLTDPIHGAALSLLHTTVNLLEVKDYSEKSKDMNLLLRFSDDVGEKALEISTKYEES